MGISYDMYNRMLLDVFWDACYEKHKCHGLICKLCILDIFEIVHDDLGKVRLKFDKNVFVMYYLVIKGIQKWLMAIWKWKCASLKVVESTSRQDVFDIAISNRHCNDKML